MLHAHASVHMQTRTHTHTHTHKHTHTHTRAHTHTHTHTHMARTRAHTHTHTCTSGGSSEHRSDGPSILQIMWKHLTPIITIQGMICHSKAQKQHSSGLIDLKDCTPPIKVSGTRLLARGGPLVFDITVCLGPCRSKLVCSSARASCYLLEIRLIAFSVVLYTPKMTPSSSSLESAVSSLMLVQLAIVLIVCHQNLTQTDEWRTTEIVLLLWHPARLWFVRVPCLERPMASHTFSSLTGSF